MYKYWVTELECQIIWMLSRAQIKPIKKKIKTPTEVGKRSDRLPKWWCPLRSRHFALLCFYFKYWSDFHIENMEVICQSTTCTMTSTFGRSALYIHFTARPSAITICVWTMMLFSHSGSVPLKVRGWSRRVPSHRTAEYEALQASGLKLGAARR